MPECRNCGATIRWGRDGRADPHECIGVSGRLAEPRGHYSDEELARQAQEKAEISSAIADAVELVDGGWSVEVAMTLAAEKIRGVGFRHGWNCGHTHGRIEASPKPWIKDQPVSIERNCNDDCDSAGEAGGAHHGEGPPAQLSEQETSDSGAGQLV